MKIEVIVTYCTTVEEVDVPDDIAEKGDDEILQWLYDTDVIQSGVVNDIEVRRK